jgi:hypothetical protein
VKIENDSVNEHAFRDQTEEKKENPDVLLSFKSTPSNRIMVRRGSQFDDGKLEMKKIGEEKSLESGIPEHELKD